MCGAGRILAKLNGFAKLLVGRTIVKGTVSQTIHHWVGNCDFSIIIPNVVAVKTSHPGRRKY